MTYSPTGKLSPNEVIKQYTPLVKKIAHHMMLRLPSSVDVNDLIQEGLMGLHEASQRFDPIQGIQFETFVSQRVRGAMLDHLRSNDWASRSARKTQKEIKKAIQTLEHELGHNPKESEIAKKLNVNLPEYHELLASIQGTQIMYLEDLTKSDEDSPTDYLDRHTSPNDASNETPLTILNDKEIRGALVSAIENLPLREQQIMNMYYVDDMNLKEIAKVLEVTESRVCQLHTQIITRLRAKLRLH